ncbi:MAG: STAS domain-containing protein [SAR324 cluster bacterium]|nr:STAS domain-containing protein [SAR324 cluster bacterium]
MIRNINIQGEVLKLKHRIKEDTCILDIEGHLIEKYSLQLRLYTIELINSHPSHTFIINLEKTVRLDSAGLEQFVLLYKHAKEKQIDLAICHCNELINGVLKATRMDEIIPVYVTEKDALASFQN